MGDETGGNGVILKTCYHYTRLVEEEIGDIRLNGLGPMNDTQWKSRIQNMVELGYLDASESASLLAQLNPFRSNGKLFATSVLYEASSGHVRDLLARWGGETIHDAAYGDPELYERLTAIGRPIVIALAIQKPLLCDPSQFDEIHSGTNVDVKLCHTISSEKIISIESADRTERFQS